MKILTYNGADAALDHRADAETLAECLRAAGYEISTRTAHMAWDSYSNAMASGWVSLPDDPDATEILRIIGSHATIGDDQRIEPLDEALEWGRRSWGSDLVDRLAEAGYRISLADAVAAWEDYSDSMAAGWMQHDGLTGDEIYLQISLRVDETEAPEEAPEW